MIARRSARWGLVLLLGWLTGCGSSKTPTVNLGTAQDRAVIKAAVHTAAVGLATVAVPTPNTPDVALIRNYVHAVRFLDDSSGYYFVYDYTTNYNVAHAILTTWEGTDKTSYQDSRGLYVIQELSKLAKSAAGGGYLNYWWINPATTREEPKLGYVEVIPGTTLYIGSGIYLPQ